MKQMQGGVTCIPPFLLNKSKHLFVSNIKTEQQTLSELACLFVQLPSLSGLASFRVVMSA